MPLDPISALQILSTIAESSAAILGIFAMVIVFLIQLHRERIRDQRRIWERSVTTFYEDFGLDLLPGFRELVREIGFEAIEMSLEGIRKERGKVSPQISAAAHNLKVEWDDLEKLKGREIMPKITFSLFVILFSSIIFVAILNMFTIQTGVKSVAWAVEVTLWLTLIVFAGALVCLGILIWQIASAK